MYLNFGRTFQAAVAAVSVATLWWALSHLFDWLRFPGGCGRCVSSYGTVTTHESVGPGVSRRLWPLCQ